MSEIIEWSAVRTAGAIARREVSVEEVTRAHLDRIAAVEPGLRAVVDVLAEAALTDARAKDAARPDDLPPLWGLPVTVKINTDMTGRPSSNGLPALNDNVATGDAPVVANLRAAGAVIIGRTSTPEFSLRYFTSNPIYGRTLNPLDAGLTSGGSSGGASSAIAAGMGVLAHGNDLGGSLRYPAYCCGLATLRPSLGRVPSYNPSAPNDGSAMLRMMSVQGVIARSVEDVRLAHGAVSQRDPRDPLWRAALDSGRSRGDRPLRVGVAADPFGDGVDAEVAAAVATAAEAARQAGHEVIETRPPMLSQIVSAWGQLLNADVSVTSLPMIREMGSQEVNRVIDGYAEIFGVPDLTGYVTQQGVWLNAQRAWNRMFEEIDALILPVSLQKPFRADQDFVSPETLPDIMQAQRPLFAINLLGLPSAVVRTLPSTPVPLGVQVVGPMMDDALCLEVAGTIEAHLGFDLAPVMPGERRPRPLG